MSELSTKPYLVRALFDWCNDSGYTPYVAVAVGENVVVPHEYVKDGEIVLNVSPLATNHLTIGNEFLEFQARFGGVAREVRVPVEYIRAIYARETGQGMAFDVANELKPATGPEGQALAPAKALERVPGEAAPLLPAGAPVAPLLRVLTSSDTQDPPPDPPAGPPGPSERPRLTRVK
jgi:stringent starvation protein B